ncbi:insulin receptor substrate 2-like [Numida meleagris]|uniref:insulin receptor substrate 2-like n=1 Tax=Numida meleagris TaxID=8996 RepID=UPI000B3DEADF|nr:insulin receptor substrate 2-like [Numida meleagris]
MASTPAPGLPPSPSLNDNNRGVRKCGYLRKQKHGHKRFFVLRSPGGGGEEARGARLEYYKSEKKWRNKSGAPKRVIALDSCLSINKRADAKHKYLIVLYTKDEYFAAAAENEQEQEGWYSALSDLLSEGKAAAGSLLAAGEEPNYGLVKLASTAYQEVWQVMLKPKGLGRSKNLTGIHRLCLSARTISFVRLSCELPSVTLHLMNIRRCGHSDKFFFIEAGCLAATGPGELWMQADDSVVAQNIHKTILEAMKALKELSELWPRRKSQSSSSSSSGGAASSGGPSATHPITVPGRWRCRRLVNLPPSQTGLFRHSRTDSLDAGGRAMPCLMRMASKGDACRVGSAASSPISSGPVRTPFSRSHTLSGSERWLAGKLFPVMARGGLQSSRSMYMPASHSPPSSTSPISLSSSHTVPSPLWHSPTEGFLCQRCQRAVRPSCLSLETLWTMLPSMNEHPLPPEPKSPREYINIDFGDAAVYSPPSLPADSLASSLGSCTGQRHSPLSDYMNMDFSSQSLSQSGMVSVGSLEALSPGSSSSTSQPNGRYMKVAAGVACLSSPSNSEDYTEMTFGMATTPPQPIVQKPESTRVTSPKAEVKRLTLSGMEAFILSSPLSRRAEVIRADPQGRRRHSSETSSSTTTVTHVSPSFAHNPKRHNSASMENVSLRKSKGQEEEQGSSPMC